MDFIKNLANLIKVKTIVTLVVILVFAILALRGDISPDNVMNVVLIVISLNRRLPQKTKQGQSLLKLLSKNNILTKQKPGA